MRLQECWPRKILYWRLGSVFLPSFFLTTRVWHREMATGEGRAPGHNVNENVLMESKLQKKRRWKYPSLLDHRAVIWQSSALALVSRFQWSIPITAKQTEKKKAREGERRKEKRGANWRRGKWEMKRNIMEGRKKYETTEMGNNEKKMRQHTKTNNTKGRDNRKYQRCLDN